MEACGSYRNWKCGKKLGFQIFWVQFAVVMMVHITVCKILRNCSRDVNINIQCIQFPNLLVWNNLRWHAIKINYFLDIPCNSNKTFKCFSFLILFFKQTLEKYPNPDLGPRGRKIGNPSLYPVMVFIHGGGFVAGTSQQYPAYLVAERNVVVVTINYRLNALGKLPFFFLCSLKEYFFMY